MVEVRKRSGKREPFTMAKVASSIVRAGGTVELAEEVAERVFESVKGAAEVSTQRIKELVSSFLGERNREVAEAYGEGK